MSNYTENVVYVNIEENVDLLRFTETLIKIIIFACYSELNLLDELHFSHINEPKFNGKILLKMWKEFYLKLAILKIIL